MLVAVDMPQSGQCPVSGHFALESAEGHVASVAARESGGVGTETCPFLLRAAPGQTFELSFHDYSPAAEVCVRAAFLLSRSFRI